MHWQPRAKAVRRLADLRAAIARLPGDALAWVGVPQGALEELQECMEGAVVIPSDPRYEEERAKHSHYPDLARPTVIALCESVRDVRCCLRVAKKYDLEFAPRAGGHSTVGYGVPNGLLVDIGHLDGVMMSEDRSHVWVQAGASLSQVNRVLDDHDRHVPGGECDTVGVAGHMQGGGYGFTSREFGLNCDAVTALEVMLADGRTVIASAENEPDLFWAVRGGTGNNFGVLLRIEYRLVELTTLWGVTLLWPLEQAPALLSKLQAEYMREGATSKLGYQLAFSFYRAGPEWQVMKVPMLVMMCMYDGPEEEGRDALAPLFEVHRPIAEPYSGVERYMKLNTDLIESFYTDGPPHDGTFELKSSDYVARRLSIAEWKELVDAFLESPNPFNVLAMEVYGGAIQERKSDECAFFHRDVDADVFVDSFFSTTEAFNDRASAERWLARMGEVLSKLSNGHKYQNYPERGLPDFMDAYFGENADELRRIKKSYDPEGFFRFEQSIR